MIKKNLVIEIERNDVGLIVINILLAVFLITKMRRGLSTSTEVGGIWNLIQLIIIVIGSITISLNIKDILKQPCCVCILLYSIFAFLNSITNLSYITVSSLYSLGIILYPGILLCLFFYLCFIGTCKNNRIYKLVLYILAALFIANQLDYLLGSGPEVMVSNAYYILALLPIVMIYTKNKKYVPVLVAFYCIVISDKRAGLIAIALAIFGYYFIKSIIKGTFTVFLKNIMIAVVSLFILYYILKFLDETLSIGIIDKMLNLSEDGGSGRDVRWKLIIDASRNSNWIQLLLGHGNGSLNSSIGYAHNDFLQVLFEYGVLVLFFYISYYIALFSTLVRMVKKRYRFTSEFCMSIIISIILALFSYYVIEGTFITCGMICQGFMLADFSKEDNNTILEQ